MNDKDLAEIQGFFAWLTEIIKSFIDAISSLFGGFSAPEEDTETE